MSGVFSNSSNSIYATETELSNISASIVNFQSQIDAINIEIINLQMQVDTLEPQVTDNTSNIVTLNTNLAANMVQFYKLPLPTTETPLTASVYNVVVGYTNSSVDLTGSFANVSPGILQYNGATTFFFQINYQITSSIDSSNFNCIFLLHKNNTELTSSRQTVSMDSVGTHNLVAANGSALTPLSPGDTISLRAQLLDSVLPNKLNVNDLSLSIFKIPSI